jgi:hypothetical protein
MQESAKAREEGRSYARHTAESAAAAVERQQPRPQRLVKYGKQ